MPSSCSRTGTCATGAAGSTSCCSPSNVALVALGAGLVYQVALAAQLLLLALALAGRTGLRLPGAGIALYYVLVSAATVVACVRYLRFGVPAVWEKAVGTR